MCVYISQYTGTSVYTRSVTQGDLCGVGPEAGVKISFGGAGATRHQLLTGRSTQHAVPRRLSPGRAGRAGPPRGGRGRIGQVLQVNRRRVGYPASCLGV